MVNEEQKHELYLRSRVYALPSTYEPFGITLLEAGIHATPSTITGNGGQLHAAPPEKASLWTEPKPEKYAKTITQLLTDDELWKRLSQAHTNTPKTSRGIKYYHSMKDYIPSRQIPRALFLTKHVLSGKVMLELNEMRKRYNEAMRSIRDAINGRIRPLGGRGLPLVTVCIPTRNEERFIGQAIYSITHSQYRNTEIIVVDEMSSDKTRDIAKRLGARVIELDVVGNVGLPRHICSLEARGGEVIVQIDADTVLTPYVITRTVTTLINGKAMIYHVAHYYYDGNTIMNLIAHYYDKYFRKPWNTTGTS